MARLLCEIGGAQKKSSEGRSHLLFCNDVIFTATLVLFQFPRPARSTFYLPAFTSRMCLCDIRTDAATCITVRTFERNEFNANDYFDERNNNSDREEVTINRLLAICEGILFFYRKNLLESKLRCTAQRIRL